jgi:hypothetical protein
MVVEVMLRLSAMILVSLLPLAAGCHLVFPFGVQPPEQPQDGAAQDGAPDAPSTGTDGPGKDGPGKDGPGKDGPKKDLGPKDALSTCPKGKVLCGATCVDTKTSPNHCGTCGNVCTANPCKNAVCTSGVCSANKPNGTTCPGGKCLGGTCCTGCINSGGCQSGTTTAVCGTAGGPCQKCTAPDCKLPICQSNGTCGTKNVSDGTACTGGTCHGGSCCTVCWDGSKCATVESNAACGTGGVSCDVCGTLDPCKSETCINHKCALKTKPNGATCYKSLVLGQCNLGSCCTGCRLLSPSGSWTCEPGFVDTICGTSGVECEDCTTNASSDKACISGSCGH